MRKRPIPLARLPLILRSTVLGASCAGLISALIGLAVGLQVYAPTAPFAAVEIGLPAALVGGLAGLGVGAMIAVRVQLRWRSHRE